MDQPDIIVEMIPIDQIGVLNPRARNRKCPSSEVLGQWGFGFSGGLGSSGVDI